MSDELTRDDRAVAEAVRGAYRPYTLPAAAPGRRRALRPWGVMAAAVVVAILAGIALNRPSALAGWTSAPTSSDPGELTAATDAACRDEARTRLEMWQRGAPRDPALQAMKDLPLVAYDRRGEASSALFADAGARHVLICVIIPVAGQPPYVELTGGSGVVPDDFGPVEVWTASSGWNSDYGGRWEIAGRVDSDVAELALSRADGESVIATVHDGWFLAWWPSTSEPVGLELRAADGELLRSVDLAGHFAHEPSCRLSFLGLCLWSTD